MTDSVYLGLFFVGLLGGTHCVGMCGGIVAALSTSGSPRFSILLGYNLGRITAYAVAGLLVGALGGAAVGEQWPLRIALYFLANLLLLAMGAYLMGFPGVLALTERVGQRLWRHLQPLTRRFLPVRSIAQAVPLGMLWGWLPCGLVYSALATALASGSAWRGGLAMLAFGLGTLPNLLLAGLVLARLQGFTRRRGVRIVSGLLVMACAAYGLWSLWRLMTLGNG